MSCQSLMKPAKFLINCRHVLSNVISAPLCGIQNCKYYASTQLHSSANLGTNKDDDDDEDLYFYEAGRRLVRHVEDPNMPKVKITFITHENKEVPVEARVGMTVMRAALKAKAPVDAACEGKKACTTCHCYPDPDISECFTGIDSDEEDLLDIAPFVKPNSRLSCQMKILKPFGHTAIKLPPATSNFAVDKKKS